ncbi:MAG: glycosyltransferase, partial [Dehalococcoidia bacterium]
RRWLRELQEEGIPVEVLPGDPPPSPALGQVRGRLARLRRVLRPRIDDVFPHVALAGEMSAALARVRPDVIFLWGGYEGVAATHGTDLPPRFAFMGDPVHLPGLARSRPPLAAARPTWSPSRMLTRLEVMRQAQVMVRLLARCDSVAATAAHHAAWFRRRGLAQCRYLPNMAPDWGGVHWERRRQEQPARRRLKIVCLGHVTGTATLAGLHLLADETLPALERALGRSFELHICGKGQLPTDLAARLDRPSVRLRGYVDDIVTELLSADVFLVPTPIELGIRVRIPYAWSVGCCVVAHRANAAGLPELAHEENALLASDGPGLADAVARVCRDPGLRRRLGRGGRQTYETHFSREVVSAKIVGELERLARSPRPQRHGALAPRVA